MKAGFGQRVPHSFPAVLAAAVVWGAGPVRAAEPARVDFSRDVRPILAENCFACHGPDARDRKASLRLDVKDDLFADRGGYRLVVPGKPAESELISRIASEAPGERMPPAKSKRSVSKSQIDLLKRWVAEGAAWGEHWAFVAPRRPPPPRGPDPGWCRNPVDPFVLAKLEAAGLTPSPEADRVTLLRRLRLDLTGLPPDPAEVDAFLADGRPDAYERLVDRLLASPHFGERWGKPWLDLARYADSDGYEDDLYRPDAWRFRDWVIDAFNRDLPFDRFSVEQIAGDLLPGATLEQKIATGFHRMTQFNRSAVGRENEEEFRVKTVKDRAGTTATVWLGLTFGCAECHTHKYDPLPQRDYYRFYAFFNGLVDADVPAPAPPEKYAVAYREAVREFEEEQRRAKAALAAYEKDGLAARQAEWERSADARDLPAEIAAALRVPAGRRDDEQARRLREYFRATDAEHARLRAAVLDGEQIKNNRPQPPSTKAMTLAEAPEPRRTFVQVRGDYQNPGEAVTPGTPGFLPPLRARQGVPDRLDLARWVADPGNPLAGRVAVNHVWQQLFGRGLVATPENFGLHGEPPSHPELLDWLSSEFVGTGWSRKRLIRLLVTSATYRQSSRHRAELAGLDPHNALLARQNRLRVEAEVVRDLALTAAGLLNPEVGGPAVQPPLPDSLLRRRELRSERLMAPSKGADRHRRGVYVNVQRTFPFPMLKEFDGADASAACTRRERSNTPLQALTLLNDPVFTECARALGLRAAREGRGGRDERARYLFRLCLARAPSGRESEVLGQVYETHRVLYESDRKSAAELLGGEPLGPGVSPAEVAAWVAVARALLNLDEFITRE